MRHQTSQTSCFYDNIQSELDPIFHFNWYHISPLSSLQIISKTSSPLVWFIFHYSTKMTILFRTLVPSYCQIQWVFEYLILDFLCAAFKIVNNSLLVELYPHIGLMTLHSCASYLTGSFFPFFSLFFFLPPHGNWKTQLNDIRYQHS